MEMVLDLELVVGYGNGNISDVLHCGFLGDAGQICAKRQGETHHQFQQVYNVSKE